MRVLLEFGRDIVLDGAFDGDHVLAGRHAGAVAKTKDVGVDRLGRKVEPHIQDDIGGLAPDARQT